MFGIKNKKNQEQTAQDQIPIKMLDSGMFVTTDDRLVKILKVSSVNTHLMSKNELKDLLENYEAFLNSINFAFQIQIVSMPVDLKNYIKQQEDLHQKTKNFNQKALIKSYIDYCRNMESSRKIMQRQRYIIFDEKINGVTTKEYEDALSEIDQKTESITTGLKDVKLTCESINNSELVKLFQVFFNYEDSLYHTIDPMSLSKVTTLEKDVKERGVPVLRPKKVVE